MEIPPAAAHGRGQSLPRASWIALGLLLAAYTFSWVDRYIFAILIEPIRVDLGLADWQIGLLTGFGFTLAYSIAGFPLARWADRGSRGGIISLAMGCWSLITVLCGFATNFVGLALARSGVAVCEAGCSPAAHSLISDLFPRHRRALAFAIYGLGIPFGIWLGLALGGLISQAHGWRVAFIALGAPGLMMAVIFRVALREPPSGRFDAVDHDQHYPWRQAVALLWERRAFVAIALGLSLLSFNGSGLQLWAPSYMLRAGGTDIAPALFHRGIESRPPTFGAGNASDHLRCPIPSRHRQEIPANRGLSLPGAGPMRQAGHLHDIRCPIRKIRAPGRTGWRA